MGNIREAARFYGPEEAEVAASFLRARGIPTILPDRHFDIWRPDLRIAVGGLRLMVFATDEERARALLADIHHADRDRNACPACRGVRVANLRKVAFATIAATYYFGVWSIFPFPFARPKGKLKCLECKHVWRTNDGDP